VSRERESVRRFDQNIITGGGEHEIHWMSGVCVGRVEVEGGGGWGGGVGVVGRVGRGIEHASNDH